ncbi:unnamed protein product [Amoebophrya sp. A120]|nr:unnamed protein product [Amoebophrya sp. A120]|eukprot:GSA120T00021465001.1
MTRNRNKRTNKAGAIVAGACTTSKGINTTRDHQDDHEDETNLISKVGRSDDEDAWSDDTEILLTTIEKEVQFTICTGGPGPSSPPKPSGVFVSAPATASCVSTTGQQELGAVGDDDEKADTSFSDVSGSLKQSQEIACRRDGSNNSEGRRRHSSPASQFRMSDLPEVDGGQVGEQEDARNLVRQHSAGKSGAFFGDQDPTSPRAAYILGGQTAAAGAAATDTPKHPPEKSSRLADFRKQFLSNVQTTDIRGHSKSSSAGSSSASGNSTPPASNNCDDPTTAKTRAAIMLGAADPTRTRRSVSLSPRQLRHIRDRFSQQFPAIEEGAEGEAVAQEILQHGGSSFASSTGGGAAGISGSTGSSPSIQEVLVLPPEQSLHLLPGTCNYTDSTSSEGDDKRKHDNRDGNASASSTDKMIMKTTHEEQQDHKLQRNSTASGLVQKAARSGGATGEKDRPALAIDTGPHPHDRLLSHGGRSTGDSGATSKAANLTERESRTSSSYSSEGGSSSMLSLSPSRRQRSAETERSRFASGGSTGSPSGGLEQAPLPADIDRMFGGSSSRGGAAGGGVIPIATGMPVSSARQRAPSAILRGAGGGLLAGVAAVTGAARRDHVQHVGDATSPAPIAISSSSPVVGSPPGAAGAGGSSPSPSSSSRGGTTAAPICQVTGVPVVRRRTGSSHSSQGHGRPPRGYVRQGTPAMTDVGDEEDSPTSPNGMEVQLYDSGGSPGSPPQLVPGAAVEQHGGGGAAGASTSAQQELLPGTGSSSSAAPGFLTNDQMVVSSGQNHNQHSTGRTLSSTSSQNFDLLMQMHPQHEHGGPVGPHGVGHHQHHSHHPNHHYSRSPLAGSTPSSTRSSPNHSRRPSRRYKNRQDMLLAAQRNLMAGSSGSRGGNRAAAHVVAAPHHQRTDATAVHRSHTTPDQFMLSSLRGPGSSADQDSESGGGRASGSGHQHRAGNFFPRSPSSLSELSDDLQSTSEILPPWVGPGIISQRDRLTAVEFANQRHMLEERMRRSGQYYNEPHPADLQGAAAPYVYHGEQGDELLQRGCEEEHLHDALHRGHHVHHHPNSHLIHPEDLPDYLAGRAARGGGGGPLHLVDSAENTSAWHAAIASAHLASRGRGTGPHDRGAGVVDYMDATTPVMPSESGNRDDSTSTAQYGGHERSQQIYNNSNTTAAAPLPSSSVMTRLASWMRASRFFGSSASRSASSRASSARRARVGPSSHGQLTDYDSAVLDAIGF